MNPADAAQRRKKFGAIERQILELIALEEQSYDYVLSQTSQYAYGYARFPNKLAAYRQRIRNAINRLTEQQYVVRRDNTIIITDAGNQALTSAARRNKSLLENKKWDRKWRIVAFDIPEEYSSLRDRVRHILKEAGFVRLQNSVWIFPHECEYLVQLIKEESRLKDHILYGVLERIENDGILKKHFRL